MRTDKRAGHYVAYKAREQTWELVKPVAAKLLALFALEGVVSLVLLAWMPSLRLAFGCGVFITATMGTVAHMAIVISGAAWPSRGAEAEIDTARQLGKLRSSSWTHLSNICLPGKRGNVDHVAVGPGGVFAIETKWTHYRPDDDTFQHRLLNNATRQARNNARDIRLRLLGKPHGLKDVKVTPVVALWGGWKDRPDVSTADDTPIIRGAHLADWLNEQPEVPRVSTRADVTVEQVRVALDAIAAVGDEHQDPMTGPMAVADGWKVTADRFLLGFGITTIASATLLFAVSLI